MHRGIVWNAQIAIPQYGGFIEKYAGDTAMALFGATTAHEDDPVHSIRAAPEIHYL